MAVASGAAERSARLIRGRSLVGLGRLRRRRRRRLVGRPGLAVRLQRLVSVVVDLVSAGWLLRRRHPLPPSVRALAGASGARPLRPGLVKQRPWGRLVRRRGSVEAVAAGLRRSLRLVVRARLVAEGLRRSLRRELLRRQRSAGRRQRLRRLEEEAAEGLERPPPRRPSAGAGASARRRLRQQVLLERRQLAGLTQPRLLPRLAGVEALAQRLRQQVASEHRQLVALVRRQLVVSEPRQLAVLARQQLVDLVRQRRVDLVRQRRVPSVGGCRAQGRPLISGEVAATLASAASKCGPEFISTIARGPKVHQPFLLFSFIRQRCPFVHRPIT